MVISGPLFEHLLAPRGDQGGHPGRSLGAPLGTFDTTFASIYAVSGSWLLLWVQGAPLQEPQGRRNMAKV